MTRCFRPPGRENGQMVTIYDYGAGLVEGTWTTIEPDPLRVAEKAKRGESANRAQNEQFAFRRAKTTARRLILTLRPSSLGTTTFRDNVKDPDIAWQAMDRFIRFVRRRFPDDKFIVFPELQQRGAVHFHFPICGWMPKQKLRYYHECWRKASGKHGGTFNVSWNRKASVSDSENTVKICNYPIMYLSKQLGKTRKELGQHRYRASKEIKLSRTKYLIDAQTLDRAAEGLVALIEGRHSGEVKYYFRFPLDSKVPVFGWACTWGRPGREIPLPIPT